MKNIKNNIYFYLFTKYNILLYCNARPIKNIKCNNTDLRSYSVATVKCTTPYTLIYNMVSCVQR